LVIDFKTKLTKILDTGTILFNEPMKNHTSFKIGGEADALCLPEKTEDIIKIIKFCKEENIPYFVMGNGSNLLVSDSGFRGVIIKLYKNYSEITVEGNEISAFAGALLSSIATVAYNNSLTGFEFAHGIPGTIGGAVLMNAGAYGGEMKDVVFETEYIDENLNIVTTCDHGFSYRDSIFQKNGGIITKALIKLTEGDKSSIREKMDTLSIARREKQPLNFPSAGSAFKRPAYGFAAKLIDDSGLRGYSIGDAQVSEKHAGFIINKGNATAKDVLALLQYIAEIVQAKYSVDIQPEVKFIGEK